MSMVVKLKDIDPKITSHQMMLKGHGKQQVSRARASALQNFD